MFLPVCAASIQKRSEGRKLVAPRRQKSRHRGTWIGLDDPGKTGFRSRKEDDGDNVCVQQVERHSAI